MVGVASLPKTAYSVIWGLQSCCVGCLSNTCQLEMLVPQLLEVSPVTGEHLVYVHGPEGRLLVCLVLGTFLIHSGM